MLSLSPVVEIGTPPTPHPQASVPPPPSSWGRGTLAGESGWESPNSDEGTYTVVLFTLYTVYMYFVARPFRTGRSLILIGPTWAMGDYTQL